MPTAAAFTFLLENVTQLIISQAELLIDSKEEISWIQTEFRVMVAFLQSIDALHQLPESAKDLVNQTTTVVREAEDLIETYAKKQSQLLRTPALLRWPIGSLKLRSVRRELWRIEDEVIRVRDGWKSVLDTANIQHLPGSSSQRSGFAAMGKLDTVLQVQYLDPELQKCIKWVRDELPPLHDFLQESDNLQVLGERDKIWIQELRGIFQFIDESFPEEKGATKKQRSFLRCGVPYFCQINLGEVVSEIQDKILQLYRRYYAYGFGGIPVNNGSRSIFPTIRMTTPIPAVSSLYTLSAKLVRSIISPSVRPSQITTTYLTLPTPGASIELLRVDLKLMKALLDDTRSMGYLDERAKVWLNQLQEIAVDLEALDEHVSKVSGGRNGVFYKLFRQTKIYRKLKRIAREISDITARKMTYGIGSALGEARMPDSVAATLLEDRPHQMPVGDPAPVDLFSYLKEQIISKAKLRRQVEPVRKELQLIQALFEDVKRMEKLDAGLKIWVEEMRGVDCEAKAAVEPDYKSFYTRNQAAWRIKQLYNHIFMMSQWKHTYDIGEVKSSRTIVFNHNLEKAAPYPSNAVDEGLELCKRELKFIQTLYGDIEENDKLDGTAKAWIEEMQNLTVDATEWISRNAEYSYGGFATRKLCRMRDKIKQLSKIKIAYGIEPRRLPPYVVHEIEEKLLADQEQSCIIPISGMRIMHKEALHELIYRDNAIRHRFNSYSWVHVPENCSGPSILECMVRQIMEHQIAESRDMELAAKLEAPREEMLTQMLQKVMMHKRYLIVLDEIHSIEVWQHLERVFPRISSGSRVILISNEQTPSFLNSSSIAIVDPAKVSRLPSDATEVMPGSDAFDINNVSFHLRQCLYYFLLFPANFEVPTRRLKVLWAAEGLVRGNELESDDDVANSYLNELIDLNIVHGKMKKLNGKYKACELNEKIRATLSTRAKESRFFQKTPEELSRLVDHHGTSDSCFIHIHGNHIASSLLKKYESVLSFMSFNTQEGNKPGEDLGNFLHKCISARCFLDLRVLDLEKVFRPKLPEAICDLILLRYLGLRWTYLGHLPKYINRLLNLQVLDVKHTYISVLPRSIWSMQYLRHLYLSETYRTKFVGCPAEVSLDELQTLWGAFIDEDTYVRNGLDKARNIRKLGLSCRPSSSASEPSLMSGQLEAINAWISKLKHLEVLRFKSRDEQGKASKLHLKSLSNEKLSTVYLLGKLDKNVVPEFPVKLIDITLSGSELNVDPMISLEKLPQLRILRLLSESLSVECTRMRCSSGGFPQLKVLIIWKLESLEEWEVEGGALHSLEDLEIRSCEKLKMLPDLQHVATLRECRLTSMSEEFIDETKKRQTALWSKIKLHPNAVQEQF